MKRKFLLILLLTVISITNTLATHVVGGTLEYERIGTGSLPNSSRYKIKLKMWRDADGNPWFPVNPYIVCRGDTLGLTNGFDPYVNNFASGYTYPFAGLARMRPTAGQFNRDFRIACGVPEDTLTVRTGAINTTRPNNNTTIRANSGLPGYENPSYVRAGYPNAQFNQNGFGFARGVCNAGGGDLGPNGSKRPNYTDACAVDQTSPYGRLCVPQFVDSCTFLPKVVIQYAEYIRVIDLPNIPGGYHLSYELCCRNNALINLNNPGGTGFTVYARIPDIAQLDQIVTSYAHVITITSPLASTVTSAIFRLVTTSGSNQVSNLTSSTLNTITTVPSPFVTNYTILGLPSITGINATVVMSNRIRITTFTGFPTTITTQTITTSILGITTSGLGNSSLAYPSVISVTGLNVPSDGATFITASGLSLNNPNRVRNSSPTFKTVPPLFVCQYNALVASLGINQNPPYDHGAFDADGDDIEYDISTPLDGMEQNIDRMFIGDWKRAATNVNGRTFNTGDPLVATTLPGFPYPESVNLATFNRVVYRPPFTVTEPLGSGVVGGVNTSGIILNSLTGMMDIKPLVPPGLYVVNIRAREFRKNPDGSRLFLGEVSRDYQFNVLQCPLPAQPFIGNAATEFGLINCSASAFPIPNSSTAAAFLQNRFFWDFGVARYFDGFMGSPLVPIRVTISGTQVAVPGTGNFSTEAYPTVAFYATPGTYYSKLVVQERGTKCADSVFQAINASTIRAGWRQTPEGNICINSAINFDPYQPNFANGFVTISGSSSWTSAATNPIPRVSVTGFTGVSATYTGIATSVNGVALNLVNYSGFIDNLWMQAGGSRSRIPPPPAQTSRVVRMVWDLGNGNTQSLTLNGTNWQIIPPLVAGVTINGANTLPNTNGGVNLNLPILSYRYPAAGSYKAALTVFNQFGCVSNRLENNIFVIQDLPRATGTPANICVNSNVVSVLGAITVSQGGIWSGGLGTYLPSTTQPGSSFTLLYRPTVSELTPGNIIPISLRTYGNGVCPTGVSTIIGINVLAKPRIAAGASGLICGNNKVYNLSGSVTGIGTNGSFSGFWFTRGTGTFASTSTNVSNTLVGLNADVYTLSKQDSINGSVRLILRATNTGICRVESDSITLTLLPASYLPMSNANDNQIVCANNATVQLAGSVTNSPGGGIWSTLGSGRFGPFATNTLTTIAGNNAFYIPSPADTLVGTVRLVLSTNININNSNCLNVRDTTIITITPSPRINYPVLRAVCINNPVSNIVATITGSTGVIWQGISPPIFGNGSYNPSAISPNFVDLGGGRFQSSLTYTALQNEAFGFKLFGLTTTGNGLCRAVQGRQIITYAPAPTIAINGPAVVNVCKSNTNHAISSVLTGLNTTISWTSSGSGTFSSTNTTNTQYSPSTSDTLIGTVRLIIKVDASDGGDYNCKPVYDTLVINYTNLPTVSPGPNQIICENNLEATLNGSVTSPASGGIWSTNGTGSFGTVNSGNRTSTNMGDKYFPSNTEFSSGSVLLTLSTTGPNIGGNTGQCAAVSRSMNINFSVLPDIRFGTIPNICENNATIFLTASIVGQNPGQNITANTMGTWSGGNGTYLPNQNNFSVTTAGGLGLIAVGTLNYSASISEIFAKIINLTLTASNIGNCRNIVRPLSINISPGPTVNIITSNPTVCANNSKLTSINASISGASSAVWSGGINSVQSTQTGNNFIANYVINTTEINNGTAKLFLTSIGNFNNCQSVKDSILVTITKAPIVSTGGDMVVCGANNQVTITGLVSVSGIGGIWNTSGSGTFLTTNTNSATINGNNMTVVYRPSALDKLSILPVKLKLTSNGNGNCLAVFDQMNLSFSTIPVANAGTNQIVCSNDVPVVLNATGNNGAWDDGGIGGSFDNPLLLSTKYNPPSVPNNTRILLRWTTGPQGLCLGVSDTMNVRILSSPRFTIQPITPKCGSSGFFPLALTATSTGITGTWAASGSGFSTTGSNFSFTTNDFYKPTASDINQRFVTLTFSGTSTINPQCSVVRDVVTVTIDPPIIAEAGPNQLFCNNLSVISLNGQVFINGIPTTSGIGVRWSKPVTVTGTFSGTNLYNPTFTPSQADLNSGSIRLIMTATAPGIGSCTAPRPDTVTYTIQASPLVSILGSNFALCSDQSFANLNGTFAGLAAGIVWSSTGVGAFRTNNTQPNVQYEFAANDIALGKVSFRLQTQGSGVCPDQLSNILTVTIVGKPIISAGPDLNICNNNTIIGLSQANMTTTGGAIPSGVLWYLSNNTNPIGSFSGFSIPINNVGTPPNYFPSLRERITDQIVTVSVSVSGVGTTGFPNVCPGQIDSRIITFYAAPTVNTGTEQTICGDASSDIITLVGSATVSASGRWSANNGTGTIVGIGNGFRARYFTSITDKATLTTTLGFTFTTTFAGCLNETGTKKIILTSLPGVSIASGNQTICGDALFTKTLTGASSSGFGMWSSTTLGTFSPNSSTLTGVVFGPLQSEIIKSYTSNIPIRLILTSDLNGVCTARSASILVTVTPPPRITAGSDTSVCTDVNFVRLYRGILTVSSGMVWSTASPQGRFSNNLATIVGTSVNTANPIIKNILFENYTPGAVDKSAGSMLITARTTGSGQCAEVFDTKNITFVAEPTVTVNPDQDVCANNSAVNIFATVANTTKVRWFQQGGDGNFLDENTANTVYYPGKQDSIATALGGVVTLTCSVVGNNLCQSKIASFRLRVTQSPVIKTTGPINICADTAGVQINGVFLPTLTTVGIQWRNLTNPASTAANFSANPTTFKPFFKPSLADIASGTIKLLVSTTGNGLCKGSSDTLRIIIQPKPTVTITPDMNLCSDFSGNIPLTFNGTNLTAGTLGRWISSGNGNFGVPDTKTLTGINDPTGYNVSPSDLALGKVVLLVSVKDGAGLCKNINAKVNVTFTGAPVVAAGNNGTRCYVSGSVITLSGSVIGSENYTYIWTHPSKATTMSGVFLSNNRDDFGSVLSVTSNNAIDRYRVGLGDGASENFTLNVTSSGVCLNVYSSNLNYNFKKPIDLRIISPNTICSDVNTISLQAEDQNTGFSGDPTFNTNVGDGIIWTARNSNGVNSNFTGFSQNITYSLSASDKASNRLFLSYTTTGSSICPQDSKTATVVVDRAPILNTLAGIKVCSNNSTIALNGSGSNLTTVQWASSSQFPGTFSGGNAANLNSLTGLYFPSQAEIANGLVNFSLTASKNGCKNVIQPLAISIINAPIVSAGIAGAVCSLAGITITGGIQPPLSTLLGTSLWSIVSGGGTLLPIDVISTTPGIMTVRNVFTPTSGSFVTLRLTANEPTCLPVSSTVTYTYQSLPVINPGIPISLCASDVIQLSPDPNSSIGIWSTSGLGFFASTQTKNTSKMNDIYIPSINEITNGTIVGFTLIGQPTSCGTPINQNINYTLTSGITVKADVKRIVSLCANTFKPVVGTISGSSFGIWTTNGSGSFTGTGSIRIGESNVSGTLLVGNTFTFSENYEPSEADKSVGRVVLRLTAVPDGVNSACSNLASDTLSIFFTQPPSVNGGGDRDVCANVAISTLPGGGVSLSGSAFLPSPNSSDPNATPVNAARYRIIKGNGTLLSSGTTTGTTVSFGGTNLNVSIFVNDVYQAVPGDTNKTFQPVEIIIEALYVGTILGGATCTDVVSTVQVTFSTAPYAYITQTSLGICADLDEINLFGQVGIAQGGVWSTSGLGLLAPDNTWRGINTPLKYILTNDEKNTTVPLQIKFSLETTNNFSCFAEISPVLTVTISPKPNINVTTPLIVCSDLATITLNGNNTGAIQNSYNWITGNQGNIAGISAMQTATLPGLYTLSQNDLNFGFVQFTLSTSGPNTCKPLTKVVNVQITPEPILTISPRQEICRDVDTIKVSANVEIANGVFWAANRFLGGIVNGTATGIFISGTSNSFTGVFLPSTDDLLPANADSLRFTAISVNNNPNAANPSCNGKVANTFVKLTPRVASTIAPISMICADLNSIILTGNVSIAGGGKWSSSGGGLFFNEFSLPNVTYQLSAAEKNIIFPTTVNISLTTEANGSCKAFTSDYLISITGSPKIETGPDKNVCSDIKTIDLMAAIATLTGGGFTWNTFGTGTFTGGTYGTFTGVTSLPGTWNYLPSVADSANGSVILVLTTTGPNPCTPISSFMTIRFERTPNVTVSAGLDQIVCADNPLINLNGVVINGQKPFWQAIKPTISGNDFSQGTGRGTFSPDIQTLSASYFPSIQDTSGATKNFTEQLIKIRLTAFGLGTCSNQIYESDMNVTFTPLPRIDVLITPNSICENDNSQITISGLFLNTVANGGRWTSSGTGNGNDGNSGIPFASVLNPPSVTGIIYLPSSADKSNGSGGNDPNISGRVGFTFTTQAQGTCRPVSKNLRLNIFKAPAINAGIDQTICENQTIVGLGALTSGILSGKWRSSGTGIFDNNTNPGGNVTTTVGLKLIDNYRPSLADINSGKVNLFVASTQQSNGCPSDSTKISLSFDLIPIVNAGLDQTICAEPGVVSLSGSVLNVPDGIWSVSAPGSGSFSSNLNSTKPVFTLSSNDKALAKLILTLVSNSATSKCPAVASMPLTINIDQTPSASINFDYLCTSTGLNLYAAIKNSPFGTWSSSGIGGIFSPTSSPVPFTSNAIQYIPSISDLTAGNVTLTLEAKGKGFCKSFITSITPSISSFPLPPANAGKDDIICNNLTKELVVEGYNANNNYSYQWFVSTFNGISTILSPIGNPNDISLKVVAQNIKNVYVLSVLDNVNKCTSRDTVTILTITPVKLPLQPRVCYTDDLTLSTNLVTFTGGSYQWYRDNIILPQDQNPNRIKATIPALYSLEFTQYGCQSLDTTNVTPLPLLRTRGKVVCQDTPFDIQPNVITLTSYAFASYSYKWYHVYNSNINGFIYNPSNTNTVSGIPLGIYASKTLKDLVLNRDSAKYLVSVYDAYGCESYDTVRVKTHPIPQMTLENNPACEGDLITLDARPLNMRTPKYFSYPPTTVRDTINAGFKWTSFPSNLITAPNDTIASVVVTSAGAYFAKYQIGECVARDTSKIEFNILPTINNLPSVTYCPEGNAGVTLDAGFGPNYRYLWLASGKTTQYEVVYDTTKYYFKVFTNKNCSVLDSINVKGLCDPQIFTPDAFIPDGSDPRDQLFYITGKYFSQFMLRIYNRWGEVIFVSEDRFTGWDGTYQGSKMPMGSYPYVVTYTSVFNPQKILEKRNAVMLIR